MLCPLQEGAIWSGLDRKCRGRTTESSHLDQTPWVQFSGSMNQPSHGTHICTQTSCDRCVSHWTSGKELGTFNGTFSPMFPNHRELETDGFGLATVSSQPCTLHNSECPLSDSGITLTQASPSPLTKCRVSASTWPVTSCSAARLSHSLLGLMVDISWN